MADDIRDLYGCGAVSNATSKRSPVGDKRTDVHDSESAEQTSVNIEQKIHEAIGCKVTTYSRESSLAKR